MGLKDLFRKKKEDILVEDEPVKEDISTKEIVDEKNTADETTKEIVKSPEETIVKEQEIVKDDPETRYTTLERKYIETVKNYNVMWNDCAYRGVPYDEMAVQTEGIRKELMELSQEMRLIKEPRITYRKKNDKSVGNRYKFSDFIDMCRDGVLIDDDGFGLYASSKGVSDIEVYPSDIIQGRHRNDFSHVIWYNK